MKRVDARGLSCPEPVIQTKNAMASKEAEYEVLVDNVVAKENVSRFVMHQGYQVNVEEQGDDFLLKITNIFTFFYSNDLLCFFIFFWKFTLCRKTDTGSAGRTQISWNRHDECLQMHFFTVFSKLYCTIMGIKSRNIRHHFVILSRKSSPCSSTFT